MDTSTNIINNSYYLWSDEQKKKRTTNIIKKYGTTIGKDGRIFRTFYTGIPDGKTFNGWENGTFMISSRIERH